MTKPARKPQSPNFSSGPCAKRPGYDVARLDLSALGRSHRSSLGKKLLGACCSETARILDRVDHRRDHAGRAGIEQLRDVLELADRDAGDGEAEYQMLGDTPGDLHIEVQKVAHPSRVHLDIETDDVDAEADRLAALGAKKIAFVKRWWVMEAPNGQRLCVVKMKDPSRGQAPHSCPAPKD